MSDRAPVVQDILLASDAARKLTHPELLALGVVARTPQAWSALADLHAMAKPRQPTIAGIPVTLTTRLEDRYFWALPVGLPCLADGVPAPIQKEEGAPVYQHPHGGGDWLLQIAPEGTLYRVRL